MRALCSIVVVCLVAACGVAPATARAEPRTASITASVTDSVTEVASNAGMVRVAATRPALHAVTRRAREMGGQLPPIALATAYSPLAADHRVLPPARFAPDRVTASVIRTGSARGPPIA
jgi:hypothetical protein